MIKKVTKTILIIISIIALPTLAEAKPILINECVQNTGLARDIEVTKSFQKQIDDLKISDLSRKNIDDVLLKINSATKCSDYWYKLQGIHTYKQKERYYCVPAAVQSIMEYLTGNTYNQDEIALQMGTNDTDGTTLMQAQEYINNSQDKTYYFLVNYPESIKKMMNDFNSALFISKTPPLIGVKMSTDDGWPYNSNGHALVIIGNKREDYYLSDSYIEWMIPGADAQYEKSAYEIYDGIVECEEGYLY